MASDRSYIDLFFYLKTNKKTTCRTSLVAQWLSIPLPMQGMQV